MTVKYDCTSKFKFQKYISSKTKFFAKIKKVGMLDHENFPGYENQVGPIGIHYSHGMIRTFVGAFQSISSRC